MSSDDVLITKSARKLPVWAMGLANMPTGFVYGFISTAMGILLASRHVSPGRVGAISAVAFSPTFWAWLFAPVLDVRFNKRFYGYVFSSLAALLLVATVFSIANLTLFTGLLTASCACIALYSSSVQGCAADFLNDYEYDAMSGWLQVANLGAAGVFSAFVVVFVRVFPLPVAAVLLGILVMAPTVLLRYFPAPRQPEGTLRENFAAQRESLKLVLRQGRLWVGLTIFLAPTGGFALTNLFSTLGGSFNVGESWVTSLNGPGVAIVCSVGALLGIPLCRKFKRRNVFLLAGVFASVAAAAMGLLPHTLWVYAAGLLAYNFAQGFNFTAFTALELEIVGPKNALAGSMIAMMSASSNFSISFMTYVDSKVFDWHGLNAMLFVDAAGAVVTAILLWVLVLPLLDRWVARRDARGLVLE